MSVTNTRTNTRKHERARSLLAEAAALTEQMQKIQRRAQPKSSCVVPFFTGSFLSWTCVKHPCKTIFCSTKRSHRSSDDEMFAASCKKQNKTKSSRTKERPRNTTPQGSLSWGWGFRPLTLGEVSLPFVTSQRADFHPCAHTPPKVQRLKMQRSSSGETLVCQLETCTT